MDIEGDFLNLSEKSNDWGFSHSDIPDKSTLLSSDNMHELPNKIRPFLCVTDPFASIEF